MPSFSTYKTDAFTCVADLYDSFYFGSGLESDNVFNYDGAYIAVIPMSLLAELLWQLLMSLESRD